MNKRILKKREKILAKEMLEATPKGDTIKTDKHGTVTNWDELSPQTKDWIKNG